MYQLALSGCHFSRSHPSPSLRNTFVSTGIEVLGELPLKDTEICGSPAGGKVLGKKK